MEAHPLDFKTPRSRYILGKAHKTMSEVKIKAWGAGEGTEVECIYLD